MSANLIYPLSIVKIIMKKSIVFLLVFMLTGCGVSHFASTYASAKKSDFEEAGTSFVIFDREDTQLLYVRTSIGDAYSTGASVGTATNGKEDFLITVRNAALNYLKKEGKKECTLDQGKEIMSLQFEFNYKCK